MFKEKEKKLGGARKALWMALAVLGFFTSDVFAQNSVKREMRTKQETTNALDQKIQEIEQKADRAIKEHPDLLKSEVEKQEAIEQGSAILAAHPGPGQAYHAANLYFGFFMANTKLRTDVCREQGVEIPTFTKTFEKLHEPETAKARILWAKEKFDQESIYSLVAQRLRKDIQADMEDQAKSNGLKTVKEACQYLEIHGAEFANEMNLSRAQPNLYRALMGLP